MRRKTRYRQHEFHFPRWGGPRPGSGPKPKGARPGVSHKTRAPLAARFPLHVTARIQKGLPSLRRGEAHRALVRAFAAGAERFNMRLVHYSIQSNHLHMILEARDRRAVSRGLQGLFVRIARTLNRAWQRKGSVFSDRYHDRILRTPREVKNALCYVLHNARKHGLSIPGIDPFSSGRWFDGWRGTPPSSAPSFLAQAATWLLSVGWRRHGLIGLKEVPGG